MSCKVINDLGFLLEGPFQLLLIEDIPMDELDLLMVRNVPCIGGGKVIQNNDLFHRQFNQFPDENATDCPCSTGNKHRSLFKR